MMIYRYKLGSNMAKKHKGHYAVSETSTHTVCGRVATKQLWVLRMTDHTSGNAKHDFDLARGMTWEEIRDDWGKRVCLTCLKIFHNDIPTINI